MLWKENIREFMKRIRQRPVRSGGSGRTDWTMWVVWSDEDGDGRTKRGTNPDTLRPRSLLLISMNYINTYKRTWQLPNFGIRAPLMRNDSRPWNS